MNNLYLKKQRLSMYLFNIYLFVLGFFPGVDEKDIGAQEKCPEHTFEVMHSRRRAYLITAESEEGKNAWVEVFKQCCRKSRGEMKKVH